jgi:CheY-like chemotaxis protein
MQSNREWFQIQLRGALNGLYSPQLLRKNPLIALLDLGQKSNPSFELQSILLEAIEALRPVDNSPTKSEIRCQYQILRRRYTEQVSQNQVAADLSFSIRQLQRKESIAREELGDYLFKRYSLDKNISTFRDSTSIEPEENDAIASQVPSRMQEMEYLKESLPSQEVRLDQEIDGVLETITPLIQSSQIHIDYEPIEDLPPVYLQAPLLRQALLNIMSATLWYDPGGEVVIRLMSSPQTITLHILRRTSLPPTEMNSPVEELKTASQLIDLCGGKLITKVDTNSEFVFSVSIHLPAVEQATVLVIDDNQDALQLFRRYLLGSRYHFIGANSAAIGLSLAKTVRPQAIVLDVMMPEQDGWRMLSLLRQQLASDQIPVIICSIFPQENLALALGASAFLRKPVSRSQLLTILGRLLEN